MLLITRKQELSASDSTWTVSQTPSSPLDLNELSFDTCRRLRHIGKLVEKFPLSPDSLILDIGGHPCCLARAFPQWNIITADTLPGGFTPYVRASGNHLPFKDKSLEIVVACDVLEHITPGNRNDFLQELLRVSRTAVIIAGPYATPGVQKAETVVRELLPPSSECRRWLEEHATNGLPLPGETMAVFAGIAKGMRVIPADTLTSWLLFFASRAAAEQNHDLASDIDRFIKTHNALTEALDSSTHGPAYRHAVVVSLTETAWQCLVAISNDIADHAHEWNLVEAHVDALGQLLKSILGTGSLPPGRQASAVETAYIERLEQMLEHRGIDPGNTPSRLRRAWRVLTGAE